MTGCAVCGFALWEPVGQLTVSDAGLYDDGRFPGRVLLSLRDHHEHLDLVPDDLMAAYLNDLRTVTRALRHVTGCTRVNTAWLQNAESHVHAHLFPRLPDREPEPTRSPWDDPRPRVRLRPDDKTRLLTQFRTALG